MFGLNDKIQSNNKEFEIQQLLVRLYSEYLNLEAEFDGEPSFDYDIIKKNVEANLPDFDWYHSVQESHKILPDTSLVTGDGDAINDLTDMIKDLLEVKWCFENTTQKNAIWVFCNLMQIHSEQHFVDLLKYLKDKKG